VNGRSRVPAPYSNPYLAGVGLGLVLLTAYVVMGRGLGASGAFASSAAGVVHSVAPARGEASAFFGRYLAAENGPWLDWLVFEIIGVAIGGLVSAWLAGRLRFAIERGPHMRGDARLATAFGGGAAMGFGAVLARGCTSGQALTGGAMLSVGSWLFMIGAFAAAYLVAPLAKRAWL
jgi:uncharacterized membrane protein YedE/YeeE